MSTTPTPLTKRFLAKIEVGDECWLWTAGRTPSGYALLWVKPGKNVLGHRFAYELLVGPVPEGLELDHLCRVRHCVNPRHLEPVTRRENILRGRMPQILRERAAAVTHCPANHPYDADNTLWTKRGTRRCRECHRLKARARYWREDVPA